MAPERLSRPATALVVVFVVYLSQSIVFLAVPLAAERSGVSTAVTGLLIAIPGAVSLLVDVPVAAYSDAVGRRHTLALGGWILAVGGMVLAVPGLLALAAGISVYALAMAWTAAPSLALVTETSTLAGQPRIQGWNGSVQALAALLGTVTGGALLASGTAVAFAPVVGAGVMVLLIAARLPMSKPPDRPRTWRSGYRDSLRLLRLATMRTVVVLAVAYGIVFLVVGNAFVPLFLVTEVGYDPAAVGLMLGIRPVVILVLSPWFGVMSRRWGVERPLAVATLMAAAGIAMVPLVSGDPGMLVIAMGLQGLGIAFSAAGANILVTGATERHERATGIAVTNFGSRFTVLVVSPILGLAYQAIGPASAFGLAGAMVVGCATAIFAGDRRASNGGAA